ncbi:MAG: sterol desaturase family protein [Betaproteobacteria bacterium]|nr:sterol desaturase family protein [Betaproteobacteria bacterium]MCC6247191.1 sterol desaturase family protein [Rubrivivax sp.]MCL4696496.1 sterol desaturase family protein [Burkholderiaceae bacterium]
MTPAQVIVLATPVFLGLIAFELAVGLARGRNTYRLADALSSIGLGVLSQVVGVFTRLFAIGLYTLAYEHVSLWQLSEKSMWVWLAALVGYDFCYYWLHRAGHRVAVLWAAHVVHHQSEDYNLSTALRQTGTGFLFGWIFYLPLAVLGVPPLVFAVVALIDLLYQFWVHTQQIDRLGWFDRWFCAPSNHRVHHAVNDRYIDKNYGGILLVWDRLFGTWEPEDRREPCVYGTRAPLQSWNPIVANLQVYRELALDSARATTWPDRLRVWLKPPGWRPADVATKWPKPAFDINRMRRYDPRISEQAAWIAATLFAVLLLVTTIFLWNAHRLAPWLLVAMAAGIVALLWAVGAITEPAADVDETEIAPDTVPETAQPRP